MVCPRLAHLGWCPLLCHTLGVDARVRVREFGQHLRMRRKAQGLSRVELAALTGGQVSERTIESYESPRPPAEPDHGKVTALAVALGWEVNEALGLLGYTTRPGQESPDGDPWEELEALRPELTDHMRRNLVTVAEIMLGRPPRASDGEAPGFLMRVPTAGAAVRMASANRQR
jgi:transcriptional regulator with XRE-family HTH domain